MYLHAGVTLVHVDERRWAQVYVSWSRIAERCHESTCRASWCPSLGTYTDRETCRRPIACLIPDVGTIMKERLPMVDIDMENEVATLHVTLGLALQKLLLVGLHFPSRRLTGCSTGSTTYWKMLVTMLRQRNVFLMQVVTLDNILTAPLECYFVTETSLAYLLHVSCQWVFKQALQTSPRAAVRAGKVLEYAYLWALACRSCKFSLLDFD